MQQHNLRDSDQPINRHAVRGSDRPLGAALPVGLSMQIDDGELDRFEYGSCTPKGCVVRVGLTGAQITAMRGKEAYFTSKDNRNREIAVPVS